MLLELIGITGGEISLLSLIIYPRRRRAISRTRRERIPASSWPGAASQASTAVHIQFVAIRTDLAGRTASPGAGSPAG